MFLTKAGDEGAASSHGFTRQNKNCVQKSSRLYDLDVCSGFLFKQLLLEKQHVFKKRFNCNIVNMADRLLIWIIFQHL